MLECEVPSSPAESALDFVHYQQGIVPVTELSGGQKQVLRHRHNTRLALDWLYDNGADPVVKSVFQSRNSEFFNDLNIRHQGAERRLVFVLGGNAQSPKGPSMK